NAKRMEPGEPVPACTEIRSTLPLADDSLPLGRAHQLASIVVKETRRAGLAVDTLVPVGDIRRYEPAVSAVDILAVAAASEHRAILSRFARLPIVMVSRG